MLSVHLSPDPGIVFWPALGLTAAAQSDLNFHVGLLSLLVVTGADDALLMQKPLLLLIPEACGVWALAPVTLLG